jgi:arylsulfatase A-like enzyme
MIRSGDWKLVRSDKKDPWELYNMENDEIEINDLSKKMPEKVDQLLKMYEQWRKERPYLPEDQKASGYYGQKSGKKNGKEKRKKRKKK